MAHGIMIYGAMFIDASIFDTLMLTIWLPGYLVTRLSGYLVTWLAGYLVTLIR